MFRKTLKQIVNSYRKIFRNAKVLKENNYIFFTPLEDGLFDVYSNNIPALKAYLNQYYGYKIDELRILTEFCVEFASSGKPIIEHQTSSKSYLYIIQTITKKKIAIIFSGSYLREKTELTVPTH